MRGIEESIGTAAALREAEHRRRLGEQRGGREAEVAPAVRPGGSVPDLPGFCRPALAWLVALKYQIVRHGNHLLAVRAGFRTGTTRGEKNQK